MKQTSRIRIRCEDSILVAEDQVANSMELAMMTAIVEMSDMRFSTKETLALVILFSDKSYPGTWRTCP